MATNKNITERPDLLEYFTDAILRKNKGVVRGEPMTADVVMALGGKVFTAKAEDDDAPRDIYSYAVLRSDGNEEKVTVPPEASPVVAKQVTMVLESNRKNASIKDNVRIVGKYLHPYSCYTEINVNSVTGHPVCYITYRFGEAEK